MSNPEEVIKFTEEVISSYQQGIGAVGQLIGGGIELLDQHRLQQRRIRESLREKLARRGSLRHKDFDQMLLPILAYQERREAEVKGLIQDLLGRQRDLTGMLTRSLRFGLKDELTRFKNELVTGLEEMRLALQRFQKEQGLIRETFQSFQSLEETDEPVNTRNFRKVVETLEKALLGEHLQEKAVV